jgi:hypothetical protein
MSQEASHYLRQIKKRMYENVSSVLNSVDPILDENPAVDRLIGEVKDFASLAQVSQREGVAIWECSSNYKEQKEKAKSAFQQIASAICEATSTKASKRSRRS